MRGIPLHRACTLWAPALTALLLAAFSGLSAQPARYSSSHFTVQAPAGHDMNRLLDELELAYKDVRSFGLALPTMVQVRSYGTTAEFVRHSGGQTFHLAIARDEFLHLQPLAVLLKTGEFSRTLRHELAHVALTGAARRGLPRWLNEGMAMVVAGEQHPEEARFRSLRQLDDTLARSRSRRTLRGAYGTAGRLARRLVDSHGREKVLALLRTVGSQGKFEDAFSSFTGASVKEWEKTELGRR